MKPISQWTDEILNGCLRGIRLDLTAEESVRDYIRRHLENIRQGGAPVSSRPEDDLLDDLHLSGDQGRGLVERIDVELKRIKSSEISRD